MFVQWVLNKVKVRFSFPFRNLRSALLIASHPLRSLCSSYSVNSVSPSYCYNYALSSVISTFPPFHRKSADLALSNDRLYETTADGRDDL